MGPSTARINQVLKQATQNSRTGTFGDKVHTIPDEFGCAILHTDDSYMASIPPPSIDPSISKKAQLHVNMKILSILEISEVDNFLSLQFDLGMRWIDPRLTMTNLRHDPKLNFLTEEARKDIWIPEVVFVNTKTKASSLNDHKAFVVIKREGNYTRSPLSDLHNAYIYQGADNPIEISRVYSQEFICDYHMANYPFDTQTCSAIIAMNGNSDNFITPIMEDLSYLGSVNLAQYVVTSTIFHQNTSSDQSPTTILVECTLRRRILSVVLTTFLPTTLICIVSFSTNFFKAFYFEAAVTVNLTSLLVLTTLFISVSNSLPQTSYIKMIDMWLIFSLLIPFSEVLLHTLLDSLRDTDEPGKDDQDGMRASAPQGNINGLTKSDKLKSKEQEANKQRDEKPVPDGTKFTAVVPMVQSHRIASEKSVKRTKKMRRMRYRKAIEAVAIHGVPMIFFAYSLGYFFYGASVYND